MQHTLRYLLVLILLCLVSSGPAYAQNAELTLTIGTSTQGRPIAAVRFGSGPRKLVVVGDTHGGPEANTYILVNQLIDYFRQNPGAVPNTVRLYLIPTINPDGLALGSRFNARKVDLNRNMNTDLDTCPENDWNTVVQGAYGLIAETGGPYPDSEVESRVIRSFLLDASGAIFFHSNAGLVFPAACEHAPSIAMAQAYAKGADYVYSRFWPKYNITGGMHDWAGSLGIAAITPELVTGDQPEFAQNLAGLQAVLAQAGSILLPPQAHSENGIAVPETIWRYWKAYGGEARFGLPLAAAATEHGATQQVFTNSIIELRPDRADTPDLVEPMPLGRNSLLAPIPPITDNGSGKYFASSGQRIQGAFLATWQHDDGASVYGPPLSGELTLTTNDGQRRTAQLFERATLVLAEDGSVRAEPLGWRALMRERMQAADMLFRAR